ncbi:MAG: AMP-binding protein, partial [Planctomycetes bacterium]|nr:AMP-binding protein [Planctomycetota bacterium]
MNESLFELFSQRLAQDADRTILRFLGKGDAVEEVSWRDFLWRAAGRAQALRQTGVARGEVLPIMRETGSALVCDFFGAILHGAIPCVLAPPNPRMAQEVFRRKLLGMLGEKNLHHIVCDSGLCAFLASTLEGQAITLLTQEEAGDSEPFEFLDIARDASAPLFLQHSSGTTGTPKAVMISEPQLMAQMRSYAATLELDGQDRIVSWLPLYHDM